MSKQTANQRQSGQSHGRSRSQRRRPPGRKQSTFGLRVLLVGILLAMGVWVLMQVPSGLLMTGVIVSLLVIVVLMGIWLALRLRPTEEERQRQREQQMELVQMEDTATAIRVRPIEVADLAYLTHVEFEYFTGALLEAAGVAFDLERIGGAVDRGIGLR